MIDPNPVEPDGRALRGNSFVWFVWFVVQILLPHKQVSPWAGG